MSGSRTEQPTPRRLREARRRGEVALSRDLSGAVALLAGLAALAASGPILVTRLARFVRTAVEAAPRGEAPPLAALLDALGAVAAASLPACAAAFLAATATGALQVGARIAPEALAFRWERLDPVRGLRRLISPTQLVQIGLRLAEVALALLLAARRLSSAAQALSQLPRLDPPYAESPDSRRVDDEGVGQRQGHEARGRSRVAALALPGGGLRHPSYSETETRFQRVQQRALAYSRVSGEQGGLPCHTLLQLD